MNTQLEIEYKVLIPKETYHQLLLDYDAIVHHKYVQINHYLMHPILDSLQYMLRIREKENRYELTLKQPTSKGTIETNIALTKTEALQLLQKKPITNEITTIVKSLNIDITTLDTSQVLTTYRTDIHLANGVLSIDKNEYHDIVDYELEFEVHNEKEGLAQFIEIITPYGLTYQNNCASKIKRLKLLI